MSFRRQIHNCDLTIREDITIDQLIDVIEGNRKYIRCVYAYNKVGSKNALRWVAVIGWWQASDGAPGERWIGCIGETKEVLQAAAL